MPVFLLDLQHARFAPCLATSRVLLVPQIEVLDFPLTTAPSAKLLHEERYQNRNVAKGYESGNSPTIGVRLAVTRLLSGMKPLPEESQESLDWKRGRKRFYFQREHDIALYYFILEANEWDEEKDDLRYDWRGNVVMAGGWKGVAARMNSWFGTELNEFQVRARMKLLESKDDEFNLLFDDAMDLQDHVEAGRKGLLSVLRARLSSGTGENGPVEHEVPEADRPPGD